MANGWREFDEKAQPTDEPATRIAMWGKQKRKISLIAGALCKVEPMNPRKLKSRGRSCVLLQHARFYADKGQVRWEDTKRVGEEERL